MKTYTNNVFKGDTHSHESIHNSTYVCLYIMLFIFTRLWSVIKPNVEEGIIVISLLKYYIFSGAEEIDEEW